MNTAKSVVLANLQLAANLDRLRSEFSKPELSDRLSKPLAYWAVADDRRLPFALLDRTVGEIVATSFEDLLATRGVGQLKMRALITLLERAAQDGRAQTKGGANVPSASADHGPSAINGHAHPTGLEPFTVNEATWAQWRACIEARGLGDEPLGRLAVSLVDMPRVIWNVPLKTYTGLTLAEIRALRAHGDKRIRGICEVFGFIYRCLGTFQEQEHLAMRLKLRSIYQVEQFCAQVLSDSSAPDVQRLRGGLVDPLVRQIGLDAGEQVEQLAVCRLTGKDQAFRVRQIAFHLGMSQSRIYQLLDDISMIMQVRWPEGRITLKGLSNRCRELGSEPAVLQLLTELTDLLFPKNLVQAADWPAMPPLDTGDLLAPAGIEQVWSS